MKRLNITVFIRELGHEVALVTWTLYKLMIPALIVVKLLQEMGALEYLSHFLAPLMSLLGLPESMGIVWATTIMTNFYAGMAVFFELARSESLTVAQVTVLSTVLLVSHGLPVEARIAQRAGVRLAVTLVTRLGGAFLFGFILHHIYSAGGFLEQHSELAWEPVAIDSSLRAWLLTQLKSLLVIPLIVAALLGLLKILGLLGVDKLLNFLLAPFLRLMGIGREAITLTVVGVTLGLSFGGGLLIREAERGHISRRDVFASITMLGLCHSLIEDTLLMMLMGAHLSGILWLRIVFTLLIMALLSFWLRRVDDEFIDRWLINRHLAPASDSDGTN
ncbi:MAG: nucleoside recognition domain-containing protein [Halioglobus sp.]